jgi:cell division protein FtsZ
MTLNLTIPQQMHTDFTPRITVIGVGGGGTNAVDNMIAMNLQGVDFVVANTDAQQLMHSRADRRIQLGPHITQGLGAGAKPEVGRAAAEEAAEELYRHLDGAHMVFITAGMGGGTGTGAAPVIARMARERNILTVGVVTKPFTFEGSRRARAAEHGIAELQEFVDTLIVIPNQNLFRLATERTGWKEAFKMADQVLYMGVKGVTDLMVAPGLVNLDFADIRTVMAEMGKAMMGTGEADGEGRAIRAAELAISNPLLEDTCMRGAKGLLINITGGEDMTLFEVDAAANRIREEVDDEANIIFGSAIDETLSGKVRVSVVATGIESAVKSAERPRLVAVSNGNLALADTDATGTAQAPEGNAAPEPGTVPATGLAGAPIPLRPQGMAHQGMGHQAPTGLAPSTLPPGIGARRPVAQPAPMQAPARAAPALAPFTEPAPLAPRPAMTEAQAMQGESAVAVPTRRVEPAQAPRPAQARPAQGALSTSETARPQPATGPNLFNRVTGLLRGRTAPPADPRPPAQAMQPSLAVEPQPGADLAPEPARQATAPSGEKIDLEIPAFLRRQYSGTQH